MLIQKGFENKEWDSFHSVCKRDEMGNPVWNKVENFDASKNIKVVKVEFTEENDYFQGND